MFAMLDVRASQGCPTGDDGRARDKYHLPKQNILPLTATLLTLHLKPSLQKKVLPAANLASQILYFPRIDS